jgi:uncharacterized protein YbjT (DUF2867 family)
LNDDSFAKVRVLVRRKLNIENKKLEQQLANFNDINDYAEKFGFGDVIFCCIGTTQKQVKGDKELYEKIDFDIPINAARMGEVNKFKKFLIVSSVGANESSSNFYLKLKGRTENALQTFSFRSISIFRPSILLGNRKEIRPGEKLMQSIMKNISFLFFGSYKKYRAIYASDVAKAMVKKSKINEQGIFILDYTEMMTLLKN